jgi:hypothetical protein
VKKSMSMACNAALTSSNFERLIMASILFIINNNLII